jgi:hypothetical protein
MNNSKGTLVYDLMETNKEWFYQWLKNNWIIGIIQKEVSDYECKDTFALVERSQIIYFLCFFYGLIDSKNYWVTWVLVTLGHIGSYWSKMSVQHCKHMHRYVTFSIKHKKHGDSCEHL